MKNIARAEAGNLSARLMLLHVGLVWVGVTRCIALMCLIRLDLRAVRCGQCGQIWGRRPVWVRRWLSRRWRRFLPRNSFPHTSHTRRRSSQGTPITANELWNGDTGHSSTCTQLKQNIQKPLQLHTTNSKSKYWTIQYYTWIIANIKLVLALFSSALVTCFPHVFHHTRKPRDRNSCTHYRNAFWDVGRRQCLC